MRHIIKDYMKHGVKLSYQQDANLLLATTGVLKSIFDSHTLIITCCKISKGAMSSMNYQQCKYQATIVDKNDLIVKELSAEGSPNQCFEYFSHQFQDYLASVCDAILLGDQDEDLLGTPRLVSLQKVVDTWINKLGVRYFNELTNMSNLIEEVGEVARLIGREYGEQSFKEGEKPSCIKTALADELADVLFIVLCLANQIGINLDDAFIKNMDKKGLRDSVRHLNNNKLKSKREAK